MNVAPIRMSRAGRMGNIKMHMALSGYDVHTVNSIAKGVGIKPSSYLRGLLAEMVLRGLLAEHVVRYGDGTVAKRLYAIPHRMPHRNELFELEGLL